MITMLFLYSPVGWCLLRGMKFLNILMVGTALIVGGCGGYTGTKVEYYENGSKNTETPYLDGKKHGMEIRYYDDGTKWSENSYVDGQKHGKSIVYSRDNGTKSIEYVYENDRQIARKDY